MWQLRSILHVLRRFSSITSLRSSNDDSSVHLISNHAQHIAHLLQEGKFSALRKLFAWPLQWLLTDGVLRKGWTATQLMTGPLVKVEKAQVHSGWLFTTAEVPLEFKNMRLAMRLTMLGSSRLIGLKFGPAPVADPTQAWQCPHYADRNAFYEEEIELGSRYKVGGTLALPRAGGSYPCLILLSGSGPCDRDSTVSAVKPFKDLAYGLASESVAVLRFDKVTHTHPKVFKNDRITIFDEYLDHAKAAVDLAQRHDAIDENRIYIAGHSLGAIIAPLVTGEMPIIAGTILMAAPARPVYRAAINQMEYLAKLNQCDKATLDEGLDVLKRQADVADSNDLSVGTPAKDLPFGIGASYWLSLRQLQPIDTIKNLHKPVLVLHGGRDYQVTDTDFNEWTNALQDFRHASCRRYHALNHAFIAGDELSKPSDYDRFANMDVIVINNIIEWLASPGHFGKPPR